MAWRSRLLAVFWIAALPLTGAAAQVVRPGPPPGPAVSVATVPGVALAPHRAVYALGLHRGDQAGGVVALRGRLALEFTDVCGAVTLNQRMRMRLSNAETGEIDSDFVLASWESLDGLKFRFSLRSEFDDQPAEEYVGLGELPAPGKAGKVRFSTPSGQALELPAGTVFPTEQLALLVRAGLDGRTVLSMKVFDGSGDDGVYEAATFVGRENAREPGDKPHLVPLKGLRSWPVRIAYFKLKEKSDRPAYEVGFRLFENGVSDELVLDYGDFAIKGALTVLELLPAPDC